MGYYVKSSRIAKSPLCSRQTHCGAKAILGPVDPWPDGQGYQQRIWCCRCDATGVRSCNTTDTSGTFQGILL